MRTEAGPMKRRVGETAGALRRGGTASPNAGPSPLYRLHRYLGNHAIADINRPIPVPAKLNVGAPDDRFERDADRVADEVMRMTPPAVPGVSEGTGWSEAPRRVQRICAACATGGAPRAKCRGENEIQLKPQAAGLSPPEQETGDGRAQANPVPGASGTIGMAGQGPVGTSQGGGQSLSAGQRAFFEPRFGVDFRQVRVHTGANAAASAGQINARAYTIGRSVVFGAGQYAPGTRAGQELLAHELTHVVQQGSAHAAASRPAIGGRGAGRVKETGIRSAIQRKLKVDEQPPADAPDLSLPGAVERLSGQTLVRSAEGVTLATTPAKGGSPTVARFIKRAIGSQKTYRLSWHITPGGKKSQLTNTGVSEENGEIVISIDPAHVGELTFTLDELVAQQIVAAIAQHDPSTDEAPKAKVSTTGADRPAGLQDDLLRGLPGVADQQERQDRIRAFVDQELTHLTQAQQRVVYAAGWRSEGVPLTEIIRGVETNSPFRISQKQDGNRVFATYLDPRSLPADADQLDFAAFHRLWDTMIRHVTLVPGQDDAGPVGLSKTAATCTEAEARDVKNSCCSPAMMTELGGHLDKARGSTRRAIERLEGDELIDCHMRKHFGAQGDEPGIARIIDQLRITENELFLSRHGWKCRPKGSGGAFGCDKRTVNGNVGYVGGSVRATDPTSVRICTNQTAPYTSWPVVFHEVSHRAGVDGAEIYQHDPGYPGNNALDNADSYTGLVETIGGPNWRPCSPKPIDTQFILGTNFDKGFVLGARFEMSPLGPGVRVVDWTLGLNFFWSPKFGVVPEQGDEPRDVLGRGYAGAETGARFLVPTTHGKLVFDATAGLGALWSGDSNKPDFAFSGRGAARWRFGNSLSGPELGLELSRLQSLTERAKGEWVLGITAGFHFGQPSKRK